VVVGTWSFLVLLPARAAALDEHGEEVVRPRLGALASPGIRTIVLTMVPVGFAFGLVEVSLPALARADGSPELAGLLLSVWSGASALGGIVWGAGTHVRPIERTNALLACLLPVGFAPVLLSGSVPLAALLIIPAGVVIAPLIATRNELAGRVSPPGASIEAFTWPTTALLGGISAGTAPRGARGGGPAACLHAPQEHRQDLVDAVRGHDRVDRRGWRSHRLEVEEVDRRLMHLPTRPEAGGAGQTVDEVPAGSVELGCAQHLQQVDGLPDVPAADGTCAARARLVVLLGRGLPRLDDGRGPRVDVGQMYHEVVDGPVRTARHRGAQVRPLGEDRKRVGRDCVALEGVEPDADGGAHRSMMPQEGAAALRSGRFRDARGRPPMTAHGHRVAEKLSPVTR